MLVTWIEESRVGTIWKSHNFLLSYNLEECKSNYVNRRVQFVILLHRFLEEVICGGFNTVSGPFPFLLGEGQLSVSNFEMFLIKKRLLEIKYAL